MADSADKQPIFRWDPKVTSFTEQKTPASALFHEGIPKVLGVLCRKRMKAMCVFLRNHNITDRSTLLLLRQSWGKMAFEMRVFEAYRVFRNAPLK